MPNFRVVLVRGENETPIRAVNVTARDAADALLIAQRHQGLAELWKDDEYVCTLRRGGANSEVWIISSEGASA